MSFSKKILVPLFAAALVLAASWWLFQPNSSDLPPQPIASAPPPAPPAILPAQPSPAAPVPAPTAPAQAPSFPPPASAPSANIANQPPAPEPAPPPAGMNDLGAIEFTDGVPLTVNLDQGKTCTINPKVLPDGTLQLSMAIEEPDPQNGATTTLSTPTIITRPGQAVSVSMSSAGTSIGVSLTPMLKDQ